MPDCKFGYFRENFIFAKNVIIHVCGVKNWGLEHDLPTSVNNRVVSLFRKDLIFTKLRIFAYAKFRKNKNLAKNSELQYFYVAIYLTIS